MLARVSDAIFEYSINVGRDCPLQQWILSDYDVWAPNPFYIGPDLGHPEFEECRGQVFLTFKEAAASAKSIAQHDRRSVRVENYKDRCWVVYG